MAGARIKRKRGERGKDKAQRKRSAWDRLVRFEAKTLKDAAVETGDTSHLKGGPIAWPVKPYPMGKRASVCHTYVSDCRRTDEFVTAVLCVAAELWQDDLPGRRKAELNRRWRNAGREKLNKRLAKESAERWPGDRIAAEIIERERAFYDRPDGRIVDDLKAYAAEAWPGMRPKPVKVTGETLHSLQDYALYMHRCRLPPPAQWLARQRR